MRREDGIELFRTVDMLAHLGEEAHPEHGQCFVVFLRVPRLGRKRANCGAHPVAGLIGRARLAQERPRDAQMLSMVKVLVADFAALEALCKFEIGHPIRGRGAVHRYYDIVISEIGQEAGTGRMRLVADPH